VPRVTERWVDLVRKLRFENLPLEVIDEAKRILLDSAGCALGGLSTLKGKLSVTFARRLGGPPEARIIGGDKNWPVPMPPSLMAS
jgi:2-methylcitrate dehydratase PrpD